MAQPGPQPKFKVLKALGKGSYGTVYKVQRLADGVVYAMKETDMGRMGPKERADAVNEIRVLGSMSHPNVVRHHETFLAGNKLCIVMEFAPAGDLASFIKAAAASKLPLPEATVWQIFLQLCQGMQAIHETCVIHRDIKPANIFMCPDNVVKIGDLGVAKALTKAHYAQTTIGTPVFMAPEVWRGLRYGYSSDLWSLGGVLYEMLTYRLPFEARTLNELKNKIIMGTFAPLKPGAPYSAALVAVCHALLNKDPRKRPTCAAILNSSEAAPWLYTIPEPVRCPLPALDALPSLAEMPVAGGGPNPQLLPTIHVPRDIRLLPNHLPKPSYGSGGSPSSSQQQYTTYLPSPQAAGYAGGVGVPAASPAMAAARVQRQRVPSAGAYSPSQQPSNMVSPRDPVSKVAGPAGYGAGAAAGLPQRRAYDGNVYQQPGGGILGVRGQPGAAPAAGPGGRSPVYGGAGRIPSGNGGRLPVGAGSPAAAGVGVQKVAGTPPRTPPGVFMPPGAQHMAAKVAQNGQQAPGLAAAGRVPSVRARALAAGLPVGAGAVAAAGGQAAAGAGFGARPGAGAVAAGARVPVRRGFY